MAVHLRPSAITVVFDTYKSTGKLVNFWGGLIYVVVGNIYQLIYFLGNNTSIIVTYPHIWTMYGTYGTITGMLYLSRNLDTRTNQMYIAQASECLYVSVYSLSLIHI